MGAILSALCYSKAMRLYSLFFVVVLVVVIVFAFANSNTMLSPTTVNIPFVGVRSAQMRLFGCLALVGLAGIYSLFWYFSSTRQRAKSADYLTKLEEMRRTLDEKEANRFAALQAQLESATQDILARVGGVAPALKGGFFSRLTQKIPEAAPLPSTVLSLEGLTQRIEKVRDELAADIASSEHEILQAIETLKDRK
jgi:type II secretory pathway component PulF